MGPSWLDSRLFSGEQCCAFLSGPSLLTRAQTTEATASRTAEEVTGSPGDFASNASACPGHPRLPTAPMDAPRPPPAQGRQNTPTLLVAQGRHSPAQGISGGRWSAQHGLGTGKKHSQPATRTAGEATTARQGPFSKPVAARGSLKARSGPTGTSLGTTRIAILKLTDNDKAGRQVFCTLLGNKKPTRIIGQTDRTEK